MPKNKEFLIVSFLVGFVVSALVLPFLKAVGFPSFDVVLVTLFGEGSILAIGFTLLLIALIYLGTVKTIKKN